jgi:hypothetical protein
MLLLCVLLLLLCVCVLFFTIPAFDAPGNGRWPRLDEVDGN